MSSVRFSTFPRTDPPAPFVADVVEVFRAHASEIYTVVLKRASLKSDEVLRTVRGDLEGLGFDVERGKGAAEKIHRPVLFGENGVPEVRYEIDAYHSGYECGLEVEAGRAWMGNAVYRDLILAGMMANLDHLVLVVGNEYWYRSGGKEYVSRDYEYARKLAESLYAMRRFSLPYSLTLVGY